MWRCALSQEVSTIAISSDKSAPEQCLEKKELHENLVTSLG
jgi:hypothetical protein